MTSRPLTSGTEFDERDEWDGEEEDYEDEDEDEGMFSFAAPEEPAVGATTPSMAALSTLDSASAAQLQHQAILQQQQHHQHYLAQQQRALEIAAGVPPESQTQIPALPQQYSAVPPTPASDLQPPPSGVSAVAPTPHLVAGMTPAAAIAARYQTGGPMTSRPSTDLEKGGPTTGSRSPPVHELTDEMRAAGWSSSGRGSRIGTKAGSITSRSSRSVHQDENGGYRVAAGGVGAHVHKTPVIKEHDASEADSGSVLRGEEEAKTGLGLVATRESVASHGAGGDGKSFRGANGRLSPVDAFQLEDFALEEEDSPYPEVRASVSNIDDPEMPCLTFRAWLLGLFFCSLSGCFNLFFSLRYPAPFITPVVIQLVTYPAGKLMAATLTDRIFTVPGGPDAPTRSGFVGFLNRWWPKWLFAGAEWSFNPGPFNIKEHCVISIMANAAVGPAYGLNVSVAMDKFYDQPQPVGFDFLLTLTSQLVGFGLAGITRRFLVWPASMIWPNNLVICTLLNTFHAEDDDGSDGSVTRYKFYYIGALAAFAYYWLPGYLFTALSWFTWICWITPNNVVVNQLFGQVSGLGMSFLSFDWSLISYIGSPLVVPWWAAINAFLGFAFFWWLLGPILYYTNVWDQAYLPISGTGIYDRYGMPYDTTMVIDPVTRTFNETAYEEYSPLFLPMPYTSVYSIAFALSTTVIVHTILYHGHSIIDKIRNIKTEDEDVHAKLMRSYPEVPDWWYWVHLVIFSVLSIIVVEVYHTELPVWGLMLAILLSLIYILPGGFVYAMTSQQFSSNLICEVIPGYLLPGKPFANMLFKAYGVQSLLMGFSFVQDLKLGHYMKIPPRITFICQIVAAVFAALTQVAVKRAIVSLVPTLCEPDQSASLTCPNAAVYYSASVIWGLIGPDRQIGPKTLYHPVAYWALIGVFLPMPFYFLTRRWPNSRLKYINIPVMLVGPSLAPPATGINFSAWILVSFVFQFYLRRNRFRWWSKYNFVLSAALDSGTVIATVFIFFVLSLPKNGTIQLNWWGNTVWQNTADAQFLPYKTAPEEGFGPTEWH